MNWYFLHFSGIGLSLLERLLLETRLQFLLRICILCRNVSKGEFVRSTLLLSHKTADIELVKMDTGDIKSVLEAAKVIKEKWVKPYGTKVDCMSLTIAVKGIVSK